MSAIIIIVIVGILAVGGYVSSKFFGHDNIIEESVEGIIQTQTGIEIDLTPDSPEKDKK